jgi:penicillin-binding protein 2
MANLAVIFANKGYFYTPHIIKDIEGTSSLAEQFSNRHTLPIDSNYFLIVDKAMQMVIEEEGGTAGLARIAGIKYCGKTGTAENPHGEDHSVFIAYAPREDPKIAIAVYIENAGFGGTWAAPLASLMIEKYLTDSISGPWREQRILDANFINP